MYMNKKQLNNLLHRIFLITWCESHNWAGRKFTDKEMYETEERIKTFVLATTNQNKKD